jgi:putative mRNA 3-end processing factor
MHSPLLTPSDHITNVDRTTSLFISAKTDSIARTRTTIQTWQIFTFTPAGIYCCGRRFPHRPLLPVPRAIITHGHVDHSRIGMGSYVATKTAAHVMRHRLHMRISTRSNTAKPFTHNGAKYRFTPAGCP